MAELGQYWPIIGSTRTWKTIQPLAVEWVTCPACTLGLLLAVQRAGNRDRFGRARAGDVRGFNFAGRSASTKPDRITSSYTRGRARNRRPVASVASQVRLRRLRIYFGIQLTLHFADVHCMGLGCPGLRPETETETWKEKTNGTNGEDR